MTDRPAKKPDRFPWFPFYVGEWRLSDTVRGMNYEQRGIYLELLCIAWGDGRGSPGLVDSPEWLASVTGLKGRWAKAGFPVLELCFTLKDGCWTNERLTEVWEIQRAKYDIRSETGRLGGIAKAKAKAKENPSNASRLPDSSQRNASGFARQTQIQIQKELKSSSSAPLDSAAVNGALASLVGRKGQ